MDEQKKWSVDLTTWIVSYLCNKRRVLAVSVPSGMQGGSAVTRGEVESHLPPRRTGRQLSFHAPSGNSDLYSQPRSSQETRLFVGQSEARPLRLPNDSSPEARFTLFGENAREGQPGRRQRAPNYVCRKIHQHIRPFPRRERSILLTKRPQKGARGMSPLTVMRKTRVKLPRFQRQNKKNTQLDYLW